MNNQNNRPIVGRNNQLAQPVVRQPIAHQNQLAPFMGHNPTKIQTNKCFGPQATKYLENKYAYLNNHKKLDLSRAAPHDHPYGAFVREMMDNAILSGCATNELIISVGTENRNQMQNRYYRGANAPKHETVHGMAPCVVNLDSTRHKDWIMALRQRDHNIPINATYHQAAKNVCDTLAGDDGLCRCVMPNGSTWVSQAVYKSVDSAYYAGVLDGILTEMMRRPQLPSFVVFNNYAKAVKEENFEYFTFDNEAKVEITIGRDNYYQVSSIVNGNPHAYKHRILNVPASSWTYRKDSGMLSHLFNFHILDEYDMGGHNYILVKITNMEENPAVATVQDLFLRAPPQEFAETLTAQVIIGTAVTLQNTILAVHKMYKKLRKTWKETKTVNYVDWDKQEVGTVEMVKWLYDYTNSLPTGKTLDATLKYDEEENIIKIYTPVLRKGEYQTQKYHVLPEHLVYCVNEMIHRPNQTESAALFRKIGKKILDESGTTSRLNHTNVMETAAFAHLLAVRISMRHAYLISNDEVEQYRNQLKGETAVFNYAKWETAVVRTRITQFCKTNILSIFVFMAILCLVIKLYRWMQFDPFEFIDGFFDVRRYIGANAMEPRLYDPEEAEWNSLTFNAQFYIDALWRALIGVKEIGEEAVEMTFVKCPLIRRGFMRWIEYFVPAFDGDYLIEVAQRWWAIDPEVLTMYCLLERLVWTVIWAVADFIIVWAIIISLLHDVIKLRVRIGQKIMLIFLVIVVDILQMVTAMEGNNTGKGESTKIYQIAGIASLSAKVIRRSYKSFTGASSTYEQPRTKQLANKRLLQRISQGKFVLFVLCLLHCITPVSAHKRRHQSEWAFGLFLFGILVLFLITRKVYKTLTAADKPLRRWVKGSCVFDLERLNFGGIHQAAEYRLKTNLFTTRDSALEIKNKIGCKCGDKNYAGQIGPIIRGTTLNFPTIKHPCELNTLAAMKRSLECVVQPEDIYMTRFDMIYERFTQQVKDYIVEEGGLYIDHQEWLAHHPIKYREKIMKAWEEQREYERRFNYDIFPKVEMQITEVEPEYLDTSLNELKERCIFGPKDIKKLSTGPVMHKLEQLLDKHHRTYCGNKNWTQICEKLHQVTNEFLSAGIEPIAVEADFSRYDSTQKRRMLEGFARFIQAIVTFKFVFLSELLNAVVVIEYVWNAVTIILVAFLGAVKAWVYGRASGDTWTTLANSINSEISWKTVLEPLGFNPTLNGIQKGYLPCFMTFKGDDMIGLIDPKDLPAFKKAVALGFNQANVPTPKGVGCIVKIVEYGPLEKRSFLSANFFKRRDGTYRMIRKPERVFLTNPYSTKINQSMKKIDDISLELLYAKGQSMLAWAEGLPIFDVLARKMISLGKSCEVIPEWADKARICTDVRDTDYEDCSEWLYDNFGVTDATVAEIERAIIEIKTPLEELIIPALDVFFKY